MDELKGTVGDGATSDNKGCDGVNPWVGASHPYITSRRYIWRDM